MAMQTDVLSSHTNVSAAITSVSARLKGMTMVAGATAGTLQFKDGGASGTILCEVDVPSNTNVNTFYVLIPGEGILFRTSIYVTFTGGVGATTAFYA